MKIEIKLPVTSNLQINECPFIFMYKDSEFGLYCNKQKLVNSIVITKNVDACNKNYIDECKKIKESSSKENDSWLIPSTEKQMLKVIKLFENVMFNECDLRLHWDKIMCSYNMDNREEEKLKESGEICWGWGRIIQVKRPVVVDDPKAFTCRMEYSEGLDIELNFFRHANVAIKEENYIEAFFNLYLILESYYSGGKYRHQVTAFMKNKLLIAIIDNILKNKKFELFFKGNIDSDKLDAKSIIRRLVRIRGKMFHFLNIDNPDKHIHYDNQEEYKNDTYALKSIVWCAMRERYNKLKKVREQ